MRSGCTSLAVCLVLGMLVCGLGGSTPQRATENADTSGPGLPVGVQYAVSAALGRDDTRYHALDTAAGAVLESPAQGVRVVFDHGGATLEADPLRWRMGLVSWGGAMPAQPWKAPIQLPAATGSKWIMAG